MSGSSRRSGGVAIEVLFSPYVLVPGLGAFVLAAYLATSGDAFEREFASRKWDEPLSLAFYGLALAAFGIGALVGDVMARRPDARVADDTASARSTVRRVCLVALLLSVGAYLVWWARGIANAGGVDELLTTFVDNPDLVQSEYLTSIPGLTTMTQLAVAAIPLALAYRVLDSRLLVALAVAVLVLALGRSILASERLALFELLVPAAYVAVYGRRTTPARLVAAAAAVTAVVVGFFVVNELRRRGAYQHFGVGDALSAFGGYYLESVNNALALVDHHAFATPFYFTGQSLWEFPGASQTGITYETVTGIDASSFFENFFRVNAVDPGVNTFGTPGSVAADFGWLGLLWLLGVGAAAGALYRTAARSPLARAVYAVWVVGMLEFERIYYFFSTRVFPAYLVFAGTLLLLDRRVAQVVADRRPHRRRAATAGEADVGVERSGP